MKSKNKHYKLLELSIPGLITGVIVGIIMLTVQFFVLPKLERNKLIEQERWRAKRDIFIKSIQIIDRNLNSASWSGPDVPSDYYPGNEKPKSIEINEVFSQLLLVSDSMEIPKKFVIFFSKGYNSSPASRGEFIILLRRELYKNTPDIKPEEVPYFF